MSQLERATWGAVFAATFAKLRDSNPIDTDRIAKEAVEEADEAVMAMRRRIDSGRLHEDDELELERRAGAGVAPDDEVEV